MRSSMPRHEHRGVFDVIHPQARKKILGFWKSVQSSHVLDLRARWFRNPYVLIAIGFLVFLGGLLAVNRIFTVASVQDFYPRTCLGAWERVDRAQGKPESFGVLDPILNEQNATRFPGKDAAIFCGNFLSDEDKTEGEIQSVGLTLLWKIGTGVGNGFISADPLPPEATSTATSSEEIVPPAPTSTEPNHDATSTPPDADAPPTSGENPASSTHEIPPSDAPASSTEEVPSSTPTSTTENTPSSTEATPPETPVASSTTPPPAPPATQENPSPPAEAPPPAVENPPQEENEPTSLFHFIPFAYAQEELETLAPDTEPETTTVITGAPIEIPLQPPAQSPDATVPTETPPPASESIAIDEHFLVVSYSVDGEHWFDLGRVNDDNWQNLTLPIPVRDWEELKKLQVRIKGIPHALTELPDVLLDGMLLEVQSEVKPIDTEEKKDEIVSENFPRIKLDESQKPTSLRKGDAFQGGEPAVFDFDLSVLPSAATSSTSSAETSETSTLSKEFPITLPVLPETVPEPRSVSTSVPELEVPLITPPLTEPSSSGQTPPSSPEAPEAPTSLSPSRGNGFAQFFLNLFGFGSRAQAQSNAPVIELPTSAHSIVAEVFDMEGNKVQASPLFLTVNNKLRVSVPEPERSLRPGRYVMKLRILHAGAIYETESSFLWGVLVVNFDKSIYTKGDTAVIGVGVVDDLGITICDADVRIEVTAPSGTVASFSTANGSVQQSPQCGPTSVTNLPDYRTSFAAQEAGEYRVRVTAFTANGEREVSDSFFVEEMPKLDIRREGPTRIYPPAGYTMTLTIAANEEFQGTVSEFVPNDFVVTLFQGGQQINGTVTKEIQWRLAIRKGETVTLGYGFQAPPESPELYKLGPLTFIENGGNEFFKESRKWQIAADAVTAAGTFFYGGYRLTGVAAKTFTEPNTVGSALVGPTTASVTSTLWVKAVTSPTRDEKLIGLIRSSNSTTTLQVVRCVDSCDAAADMTELFLVAGVGTSAGTAGQDCDSGATADTCVRPFDIAYEQLSGKAIVVYAKSQVNNTLYYRTWDGNTSSSEQTFLTFGGASIPPAATGLVNWINLKARGNGLGVVRTNDILYGFNTLNEDIAVGIWDGDNATSGVGRHEVTIHSATNGLRPGNFDVAWETQSGNVMVAWSPAANQWEYKTATSGIWTWSASSTITTIADAVNGGWVQLASDPQTDRIMAAMASIATNTNSDEMTLAVWRATTSTPAWTVGTTDAAAETAAGRIVSTGWGKSATSSYNLSVYIDNGTGLNATAVTWDPTNGFVATTTAQVFSTADDGWSITVVPSSNTNKAIVMGAAGGGTNPTTCDLGAQEYDLDLSNWQTALAAVVTTTLTYSGPAAACPSTWAPAAGYGGPQQYDFAYKAHTAWSKNWRWYINDTNDTPSNALAVENTTGTLTLASSTSKLRLRFNFLETGNAAETASRKKLQYTSSTNPNGSSTAWTDVLSSGGAFRWLSPGFCSPSGCTDDTVIGSTVLASSTEGGAYVRSELRTTSASNMKNSALAVTEYEFQIGGVSGLATNTTFFFRPFNLEENTPIYPYNPSNATLTCKSTTTCTYPKIYIAGNATPSVASIQLNNATSIVLTAYATTSITVTASTTDADGPDDIAYGTAKIFRTGLGASCSEDSLNCYSIASSSCVFSGSTSSVTCTTALQFYAQGTDASSSFSSDNWSGQITVTDNSAAAGSATTGGGAQQELLSLLALRISTSTISYGTLGAGANTGATNQSILVYNVGNVSTTLRLSGSDLAAATNTIAVGQQQYATTPFTWGAETALTSSSVEVSGVLITPQIDGDPIYSEILWGIGIPGGKPDGIYNGTTTFSAVFTQ